MIRWFHPVIDIRHYEYKEVLGDLGSCEAHIQENLDGASRQHVLRVVPEDHVSWNSDAIIMMELEKILQCLVLKLAVYGGQPSP
jgi:hypothetical protein